MHLEGTFTVQMTAEPPYDVVDGVSLGRMRFNKTFTGGLEGTSVVEALGQRGPVPTSATYVALERITGSIEGRRGSFVVAHFGVMHGEEHSLTVRIAPGSATGELAGLSGSMTINIVDGVHHYTLDGTFEG